MTGRFALERGEPSAEPWGPRRLRDLLRGLAAGMGPVMGRPAILAVDGRQGAGKSTLAARIAALVPGAAVVHTDDVAWWESFFGWDHLMAGGILEPLWRGEAVRYRPPAWEPRGRDGSIEVSTSTPLVIVEGVGSSRRSLSALIDAALWVQSDAQEAARRGIARDGGSPADVAFWHEWAEQEVPFLAADRPWERARAVVCGTPDLTGIAHDPRTEVLVGRALRNLDQPRP